MKTIHGSILLQKGHLIMINCNSRQYDKPQQLEFVFSGKPQTLNIVIKTYLEMMVSSGSFSEHNEEDIQIPPNTYKQI